MDWSSCRRSFWCWWSSINFRYIRNLMSLLLLRTYIGSLRLHGAQQALKSRPPALITLWLPRTHHFNALILGRATTLTLVTPRSITYNSMVGFVLVPSKLLQRRTHPSLTGVRSAKHLPKLGKFFLSLAKDDWLGADVTLHVHILKSHIHDRLQDFFPYQPQHRRGSAFSTNVGYPYKKPFGSNSVVIDVD